MVNNLKKMITEFLKAITLNAVNPATDKMIEVHADNDHKKCLLDGSRAHEFHHTVAEELVVTTRYHIPL